MLCKDETLLRHRDFFDPTFLVLLCCFHCVELSAGNSNPEAIFDQTELDIIIKGQNKAVCTQNELTTNYITTVYKPDTLLKNKNKLTRL